MSFQQELASWFSPTQKHTVAAPPVIDNVAPSTAKLRFPLAQETPAIVLFLRHCGCPFAEKSFRQLRDLAEHHHSIKCIAISHSEESHTKTWLEAVGGAGKIQVIVDPDREIYAAWGLGPSSFLHVLSPQGLYSVYRMGKEDGIWNRPTESGSRWQTSGAWAINDKGKVQWGGPAKGADDMPNFDEALRSLEGDKAKL